MKVKILQKQLIGWSIWFLILVLSAFTVPYYLLSNVTKFYGAFLYWGAFAIAAIVSVGLIAGKWRD